MKDREAKGAFKIDSRFLYYIEGLKQNMYRYDAKSGN